MTIAGKSILITGANRGIGRALVGEALRRGAGRVYAATRAPLAERDERVKQLILDVTNVVQIRDTVKAIDSLDILINNAGIAKFEDLSDAAAIHEHLAVNCFGGYNMVQALLPQLSRSRGAIVNVLSTVALGALPIIPAYSISKAAAFSLTQSLRALLASRGISVHAALPGPTDTDMSRGVDIPKASPESVARAIFDGVEQGDDEIFPDAMSANLKESWQSGTLKAMERQNATFVRGELAS